MHKQKKIPTAAQIKYHAAAWRFLGDSLVLKHDFIFSQGNGDEKKRKKDPASPEETKREKQLLAIAKRRRKEKKGKEKVNIPELKETFFHFTDKLIPNLIELPVDLQYMILEDMLMPKLKRTGVEGTKDMVDAIMEIRRLDMIFTYFLKIGLQADARSKHKDFLRLLLSPSLKMYMYKTWLQNSFQSFKGKMHRVHGDDSSSDHWWDSDDSDWDSDQEEYFGWEYSGRPFSSEEFKELRLVELLKLNNLKPQFWYRSFLSNVLFNWYVTATSYQIFRMQINNFSYTEIDESLNDLWPGVKETFGDDDFIINYSAVEINMGSNEIIDRPYANVLGVDTYRYPHQGYSPSLKIIKDQNVTKFLLHPWERDIKNWPYAAISSAFMGSIVSVISYVTLVRVPTILWDLHRVRIKEIEGMGSISDFFGKSKSPLINLGHCIVFGSTSDADSYRPFVVFDPPAREELSNNSDLFYSIGQISFTKRKTYKDRVWFQRLQLLSTYNTTRAITMFHATGGMRKGLLDLHNVLRMKNDRPGPFILIAPSDDDYMVNDRNMGFNVTDRYRDPHIPLFADFIPFTENQPRSYRGKIQHEHIRQLQYQRIENFEDITGKRGKVPEWFKLVLKKKTPDKEEESDSD